MDTQAYHGDNGRRDFAFPLFPGPFPFLCGGIAFNPQLPYFAILGGVLTVQVLQPLLKATYLRFQRFLLSLSRLIFRMNGGHSPLKFQFFGISLGGTSRHEVLEPLEDAIERRARWSRSIFHFRRLQNRTAGECGDCVKIGGKVISMLQRKMAPAREGKLRFKGMGCLLVVK